ncbi:hypothetical protein A2U01_0063958, partial [Trifolium medium]|nr:hypothetical protein [Trifolium medium]
MTTLSNHWNNNNTNNNYSNNNNNANNNNHANNFRLRHIATETLDDNQPSLLEKLDDHADKSKPKETEVVAEQDAWVEVDESKDEKEEIDEQDDSE